MAVNAQKATMAIAVRYLDAARLILRHAPKNNTLWEPLNHLFAMSAELALKSFLEGAGLSERDLKAQKVRHSLNGLLLLSVRHGLRTTDRVVEVLGQMDEAHSLHFYRYAPRPPESKSRMVYSAYPTVALAGIQQLIDQCFSDPEGVRNASSFPDDWPPAALPVHPVDAADLEFSINEKQRMRAYFDDST